MLYAGLDFKTFSPTGHRTCQACNTWVLKGVLHPNLQLACFVCYLKIINTFFFFLKITDIFLTENCSRKSKMALNFSRPSGF